ncbi:MAG: hypothetical protein QMC95_03155 [Desulfitobacteriaceae bacterium]|nr:hypothetical protein [Desulfitobacteriaceae bacterium]MDI6913203.1 hypothetical protein [Desulfitobacteriaceae bacterium]
MGQRKRTRDWNQLIITIATVVFACTALVTVLLTLSSWRAGREASRPYLTFKESPIVDLKNGLNIELKFINVGEHPATNLWSKTFVMAQALNAPPVLTWQHSLVNDIPKNTSTSLVIVPETSKIDSNQGNLPAHYIVVFLKYEDPIIRKSYAQEIYLRWNGVSAAKPQPIFHVEVEEKHNILKYFEAQKINTNS